MIIDLLLYPTLGGQRPAVGPSICCSDLPSGTNCESPWLEVECSSERWERQVVYRTPIQTHTHTHTARPQLSWTLTGDGVSQLDVSGGGEGGQRAPSTNSKHLSLYSQEMQPGPVVQLIRSHGKRMAPLLQTIFH